MSLEDIPPEYDPESNEAILFKVEQKLALYFTEHPRDLWIAVSMDGWEIISSGEEDVNDNSPEEKAIIDKYSDSEIESPIIVVLRKNFFDSFKDSPN